MEYKESKVLKKHRLSEITLNITDGEHGTVKDDKNGNYYLLSCKNIKNGNINITPSDRIISEEAFNKIQKRIKLEKDDILITTVGTIGEMSIIKNDNINYCFQRSVGIIKPNKEIVNPYFMYYALKNEMQQIDTLVKGAVQKCLFINDMKLIEIKIPDMRNQGKIVNVLNNIEKKIELNNKINENLHNLADDLFKNWFIDFRFPGFNGKLKETKLGLIPEDWKIERLEDIAECQNGYAFYKDGYDDKGLMVIDLGNVNLNGTFIYTNADKYIAPDRVNTDKFKKYKIYKNDLIMVMTDRKATMELLGKTGKIYEDKEYLLNQRMYRIRSKINTNFLYTALNNDNVLNKLKSKALGSVQKYVNTGHINELEIIIGTNEIMEMFSKIVDPIYAEIENRTIENTRLEKLRDILLPKLMNGEIDLDKIEI